jgi:hypothetical protein
MEANELRIGNKVYNPNHNKVYTVDGFKFSRAPGLERRVYVSTQELSEHSVLISVLEPVTLNADWLVNAGAKGIEGHEGTKWRLGNFIIKKEEEWFSISPFENFWIKVEYVHDLQNLYFYHHNKSELELIRFY